VEIISRDRAGAYAEGASKGAPQAIQIADRFHLLVNVMTAMTRLFERKHESLKRIHEEERAMDPPLPSPLLEREPSSKPLTITQARRTRRKNRYDEVKALHKQGVSQRAIAVLTGLHRDTGHRYLNTSELPEMRRSPRRSKLDPYKAFLHQRHRRGRAQRDPPGD
jgi:transposase